jgi:hypothetical protein
MNIRAHPMPGQIRMMEINAYSCTLDAIGIIGINEYSCTLDSRGDANYWKKGIFVHAVCHCRLELLEEMNIRARLMPGQMQIIGKMNIRVHLIAVQMGIIRIFVHA